MAFSDLCLIGNAYKSVENEADQSDRIMEENSMVRDLITKILDESGPENTSSLQPPEKVPTSLNQQLQYQKPDGPFPYYQNNYSYPQNDLQFNNLNGFTNGFGYNDNLLGVEPVETNDVTPEQLNLLRLAAQEIGGAQFTTPTKFENYNYFDQQRTVPETYPNFNRPNSLNLDFNKFENPNPYMQRFPQNGMLESENTELLSYLSNNMQRDEAPNNMEFKLPEASYSEELKMPEQKFFNRIFPNKNYNNENLFMNDIAQMVERPPPNFENFNQQNFKPNGFQNEFMRQPNHQRDVYPQNGVIDQRGFDNGPNGNMQQAALLRQNQELVRQMNLLMRSRPPPNPLNVDVTFFHENPQFNLGLGALIGPSPNVPPPVLPSPMLDMPLMAPFYTMRNMRGAVTSSGILHARLDTCYEQWRQLERERKRTEARLALAYPGRAVSSSNSIPVPRLPPCPTRVDRLTVDMLREHTKVLTLMGKMETLRASVCVAQNKKPNKDDPKITVLKRGQQNVVKEKEGLDPSTFDPASWREQVTLQSDIAPHSEVENAMLAWRSAVGMVQLARRRELQNTPRYPPSDPIIQLADAVKQLGICARRARCAMWCDLTLTVALAPTNNPKVTLSDNSPVTVQPTKPVPEQGSKPTGDPKETQVKEAEKPETTNNIDTKPQENNNNAKTTNKNEKPDINNKRRQHNYRKSGRNEYYQKNRYDARFMPNRQPYYLATGPIN